MVSKVITILNLHYNWLWFKWYFFPFLYRAEGARCLEAACEGRVLGYSCKLKVHEGAGRTAGSSRRNRAIMNPTSFLNCFWSSRDLYYKFWVSSYSPTAFFFLIKYLTISRSLHGKAAKSEGREYEGDMRITFKYAKKGSVSTEEESRIGEKERKED